MAVRNIKRWQWILASIVIGLAFGYVQQLPIEDWQSAFGDTLTQQQFEEGLLRKQNGQHWFRNIVLYPQRIEIAGKMVRLTIVAGDYFNGTLESEKGQRVAIWRPRCFIAEEPFHPIALLDLKDSSTVPKYLNTVPGASYTSAWWRRPTWALTLWTAASFVILGLILPTLINLMGFGSIMRPKEERGIDLSKVSTHSPPPRSQPSDADLAAVTTMGDQLEKKLAAEMPAAVSSAQSPPVAPALRELSASNLDVQVTTHPQDQKHYGQDREDFYPTERHQSHPKTEEE